MDLYNKLLSSNRVPQIRFSNFKDDWEVKKLSDLLAVKSDINSDKRYSREEVLSVSDDHGIVNQIEHLGRSYAGVSLDNYHVVDIGDLVYTKSPLRDNPYGIIKANKGKPGIVSTLYAVYSVREGNDFNFVDKYFESDQRTNRYLRPLVHKGAKNDMKINNERVLIDPVVVPTYQEQLKISNFLNIIHSWVDNLNKQTIQLEAYKKELTLLIFTGKSAFITKKNLFS
jgi:type I restriction enzyme S subunit